MNLPGSVFYSGPGSNFGSETCSVSAFGCDFSLHPVLLFALILVLVQVLVPYLVLVLTLQLLV